MSSRPDRRIQMRTITFRFREKYIHQGTPPEMDLPRIQVRNMTEVAVFTLTGFTDDFDLQVFLFFLFLAIYTFTLIGNLGLVVLVVSDSRLHKPMYYFLSVLSFLDACYSTVVTPKMLVNFLIENKTISFFGCATQMLLFVTFGTTECFLLAAMAYDRYVAIYNPLLYSVSMAPRVYVPLILASYVGGIAHATVHTVATFTLSFCGPNEIRHIFCDIPPLLAISCSDTRLNQLLLFYFVGSIEIVTILIVLVSYGFILLAILRMRSVDGRRKVFSTCGSHLTGVSIYHGTILFMYVRPSSSYALQHDMVVSVFYTVVIPMLNPVIYSWRNKDVKDAVKNFLERNRFITVDDWIQHGDHHGVKHRHHHVVLQGVAGAGSHVHEEDCPVVNGHAGQVRATRGEHFSPPFCGAHPHDGQQDESVGDEDDHDGDDLDGAHEEEEKQLVQASVEAGNGQERRDVAEDVSDFIGCTEGQTKCGHEDGDSQEVGGTGGEGFPLARGGMNLQDSKKNERVRPRYCHEGHHQGRASNDEYHDLKVTRVTAGQGQKRWCVTEKVMDDVSFAEMQSTQANHIDRGIQKADHIGPGDECAAEPRGHDDRVLQRLADRYITIHGGQVDQEEECDEGLLDLGGIRQSQEDEAAAVDHGVQHGKDNCVEHGNHFVSGRGVAGGGSQVGEQEGSVEQGDGHEHRGDDAGVRAADHHKRAGLDEATEGQEQDLVEAGICARQSQQWRDVAEEVVHHVGAAVREPEGEGHMHQGRGASAAVGQHHQAQAESPGHERRVEQRAAYCREAVQGHGGQEETLRVREASEEEHLESAATEGDALPGSQEVGQHFGSDGGGVAEVQEGQADNEGKVMETTDQIRKSAHIPRRIWKGWILQELFGDRSQRKQPHLKKLRNISPYAKAMMFCGSEGSEHRGEKCAGDLGPPSRRKKMQPGRINVQKESRWSVPAANLSTRTDFVLLGFSDVPRLHFFLFGVFLLIYVIILVGNGTIILITHVEPALHTPMYLFISNFSFVEICYVSVTLPRMLVDLWTLDGTISFFACAAQMGFFLVSGAAECFLLAVMAYDRYVAICHPLQYPAIMNRKVCVQLVAGSWVSGFPFQVGQMCQIFSMSFCGSRRINHYFCDIPPLLKLACGDIVLNEIVVYILAVMVVTVPFTLILVSYIRIISTIMKLSSSTGRSKAFSTCSSHLLVVVLFYGTASISYLKSPSMEYEKTDKLLALFYTVFAPVFNPMIYSLRNKDVMVALKKLLCKLFALHEK
ncbi:uncharacterized protein ACOB6Z_010537 [Ctenodactylus gundi]